MSVYKPGNVKGSLLLNSQFEQGQSGYKLFFLYIFIGAFLSYWGVRSLEASMQTETLVKVDRQPDSILLEEDGFLPLQFEQSGEPKLKKIPDLTKGGFIDSKGRFVNLTIDTDYQREIEQLFPKYNIRYGSVVALESKTGKILAMASNEPIETEQPLATRSTFPAASLFKVITAAAAIEESGMESDSPVYYRGGNYTLNRANYVPDARRDKRKMTVRQAMAKSCNPVFGRIAVNELSESSLQNYAKKFFFGKDLSLEFPLENSSFPEIDNNYELARAGAGFSDVFISPLHAASLALTIANDGKMLKPYMLESISGRGDELIYKGVSKSLGRVILPSTAKELTEMMQLTTEKGTARKQFRNWNKKRLSVASKTGTLSGKNPKGKYYWFIANVPAENPEISLAAMVIDNGQSKINGSALGRLALEKYFQRK